MTATVPAKSEARLYQQLRARLGYLRLNDAADALPRILDVARAEGLSLTAALERLLDIEVAATEARKLAGRLRFACLPEPWTITDFDFSAQPGVDEKLVRDLARAHAMVRATGTAGCVSCGSVAGHLAHEVPAAWLSATTAC